MEVRMFSKKHLVLIVFILIIFTPQLLFCYKNYSNRNNNTENSPETAIVTDNSELNSTVTEKQLVKIPAPAGKPTPIPILMYHEISTGPNCMWVPEKDFYVQMKYLHDNGYQTISLSQAVELLNGHYDTSKKVVLTFDDGYSTFYDYAWPILEEFDQQATIFIISKLADTPEYLNWEQIRYLASNGIEIGGHTRTHPLLTTLSTSDSNIEIAQGKQEIESRLGKSIATFCYPTGNYNSQVVNQIKNAGYVAAVTMTQQRKASYSDDLFLLPRLGVYKDDSLERFIEIIK
jgi:peptidoglycan/xylan/chitin deacetylase (PgdA/CDA1 family)